MRKQQNAHRGQAMSVLIFKGTVAALDYARSENYDIDLENNAVMRAAPLLYFVQVPPVHYAAELVMYIVDERYKSFLTDLASQNGRHQIQLDA